MIQLNAFPNVWPPSLKTNVRDFLSESSPANCKKKKKIVQVYWHDRKASYILHSLTSKRSQVTCVIHSHSMDKIMKKMVMTLKCKYWPKHNIQAYKLTLELYSRLLLTSLIHSVPWARNKSSISLLYIPKLYLHQRKVLQHNHSWATTLHLKLIFGSMLLRGGLCGAEDSLSQIC